jgi:transposase-like protein
MAKKKRRSFSSEQKAAILREHLIDKTPVSDVCDKHGLQPSVFYDWQRALMNNADVALEAGNGHRRRKVDTAQSKLEREVEALKARLAKKDEVIAEISEEHLALKKTFGDL